MYMKHYRTVILIEIANIEKCTMCFETIYFNIITKSTAIYSFNHIQGEKCRPTNQYPKTLIYIVSKKKKEKNKKKK